jgi:CMP-N-acetylneuraminic acid synthetase
MNRAPVIAVVPARGGSKGIPRKNLALLAGRPLIDFTLNAARSAGIFDEIIVSTDDAEIAEFSRSRGCSVRERPEDLASDSSRVIDCVLHTTSGRIDNGDGAAANFPISRCASHH